MKANATTTHQIKSDRATKRYGQLMTIEEFTNENRSLLSWNSQLSLA